MATLHVVEHRIVVLNATGPFTVWASNFPCFHCRPCQGCVKTSWVNSIGMASKSGPVWTMWTIFLFAGAQPSCPDATVVHICSFLSITPCQTRRNVMDIFYTPFFFSFLSFFLPTAGALMCTSGTGVRKWAHLGTAVREFFVRGIHSCLWTNFLHVLLAFFQTCFKMYLKWDMEVTAVCWLFKRTHTVCCKHIFLLVFLLQNV